MSGPHRPLIFCYPLRLFDCLEKYQKSAPVQVIDLFFLQVFHTGYYPPQSRESLELCYEVHSCLFLILACFTKEIFRHPCQCEVTSELSVTSQQAYTFPIPTPCVGAADKLFCLSSIYHPGHFSLWPFNIPPTCFVVSPITGLGPTYGISLALLVSSSAAP